MLPDAFACIHCAGTGSYPTLRTPSRVQPCPYCARGREILDERRESDALDALRVHYPTWGWRPHRDVARHYCADTPPAPAESAEVWRVSRTAWAACAFGAHQRVLAVGRGASACEAVLALRSDASP